MRSWAQWQGRRDRAQEALGWSLAHPQQTCRTLSTSPGRFGALRDSRRPTSALCSNLQWRPGTGFRREPAFDGHADGVALFDPVGHNVHPQEAIRYCSIVPTAGIEYMLSLLTLVIEAVSLVDLSA